MANDSAILALVCALTNRFKAEITVKYADGETYTYQGGERLLSPGELEEEENQP